MPRSATSAVLIALLALAALARAQPLPDDHAAALDRYLDARDLTSLRFEVLRSRIERGSASERDELVSQAADLLAELLERETDAERQREWSERARDLLHTADGAAAERLELQLLRAAYQRAERTAERWRLRTATDAEAAAALRTLTDAAARLERIARLVDQRVEIIEQRLGPATGVARDRLREEAETLRARRSQARYLAGWSRLYAAQIADSTADAEKALESFAWILGSPGKPAPELAAAAPENLKLDHVLRAALGAAAAHAHLAQSRPAREWLAAARAHAAPDAADLIDGWSLVVDASLERWDDLERALASEPGLTAARLVAVAAIENLRAPAGGSAEARDALETALATLIDLGDAASLVELSRRYGALPIAGRSFLAQFTAGLGLYLDAESLFRGSGLPADAPAPAGPHRTNFATAAGALAEAVDAASEAAPPPALAEAQAVLGAALFYAAGSPDAPQALPRAREHLLAAADVITEPARREGALWLAVRAARLEAENLDDAGDDEAARALQRQADEIAARFLREFPQSDLAGNLLYDMAMRPGLDPRRRADLLSRVPQSSSAYAAARDQSARALYDVYRAADAESRTPAALRYLDAAEPLLASDLSAAGASDDQAASRALARLRRMLDALLSMTPPDADRAQSLLARARDLPGAAEPDAALELAYRRAQIAIVAGNATEAEDAIAEIERLAAGDDRAAAYAEALRRFVFRRAVARHQHARDASADAETIAAAARRVADAGRALLRPRTNFDDPAARTAARYLAEALDDLARFAADEPARAEALKLRLEILERRPADAELLEQVARGAEQVGRPDVAQDAWNRRLALLPVDSDEWFETRYRQLRALAESDPAQARLVLRRQHRVLYPDYGPEPWGPRLRELDESLGGEP